jgi:hypothetical protein
MEAGLYPDAICNDRKAASRGGVEVDAGREGPFDLRQYVELPILLSWIEAEIERFVPLSLRQSFKGPAAAARFRDMLKLLCFAYGAGVIRSAEIAEASRQEAEFRLASGDFRPFPDELKAFRRRYRAILEVVLTRLFVRAGSWNSAFARNFRCSEFTSQCARNARDLLNVARHLDSCDDC